MSVPILQQVEWRAGASSPVKYAFMISAFADIVGQTSTTIDVRLWGTLLITNHPNNSRNSWAASDFAVLTLGGYDPADYPFSPNTSYYQAALPTLPNAPQSYYDAMIAEFRGDTWRSAGPNKSSLWIKNQGVVLNQWSADGVQTFPIDITFTVTLTGDRNQPILIWNTSGANNSTSYSWLYHQVWLSLVDLDYRPGAIRDAQGVWLSHNRGSGEAHILTGGGTWREMRTSGAPVDMGNPPSIFKDNAWYNMAKLGKE